MKIAISELEPQEIMNDLAPEVGGAIVGGGTSASVWASATAFGDVAVTVSDGNVYNYEYENEYGKFSFSVAVGYAYGYSAEYKFDSK